MFSVSGRASLPVVESTFAAGHGGSSYRALYHHRLRDLLAVHRVLRGLMNTSTAPIPAG
jgi:hypothetical protein